MKNISKILLEEIDNPDNYDETEARHIIETAGLDYEKTVKEGAEWLQEKIIEAKKQSIEETEKRIWKPLPNYCLCCGSQIVAPNMFCSWTCKDKKGSI